VTNTQRAATLDADRGLQLAFAAAVVLNLAPIAWFTYLPTRDGPSHAMNARLVRRLLTGTAGHAVDLVTWNPSPVPNWLGHALMAAAGAIVTAFQAERLLLVVIVASLPLALRYALRASVTATTALEFLAVPLAWGGQVHWGFYNYALSLSCFLVAVGYWLRHRDGLTWPVLGIWSLILVATYFAGAQALLHTGLVVGTVALAERRPGLSRRLWRTAVAAMPALALLAAFTVLRPRVAEPATAYPAASWAAANLFRLDVLRGVDGDSLVTTAMALGLGALAARWCLRSLTERPLLERALAIAFAIDVALVFLAPTTIGGGTLLTPREAAFALLTLILCFGADPRWIPRPVVLAVVAALLTVGLHASRIPFYARYDEAMREFVAGAPVVLTGGMLLAEPLDCPHPGTDPATGSVCLSGNAGAYAAIARDAVLVNNYELETAHFPLWSSLPMSDGAFVRPDGERLVDTVMLWRGSPEARRERAAVLLRGSIGCEIHYGRLVPVSVFTSAACR
jgi:hypothetical protein